MFNKLVLDISHWQGDVDFFKLKLNGVWGVILKCGGAENGKYYIDNKFYTNYAKAVQNGLHVGCYWFTGMKFDAVEESEHFYNVIKNMKFDLPVYLDWEVSTSTNTIQRRYNTEWCVNFIRNMERKLYFVGIYASDISGFKDRLVSTSLLPFTWWVARYSKSKPSYATVNCHMWQYTSKAKIDGIKGNVDASECYRDFPTIIIGGHFNGY